MRLRKLIWVLWARVKVLFTALKGNVEYLLFGQLEAGSLIWIFSWWYRGHSVEMSEIERMFYFYL